MKKINSDSVVSINEKFRFQWEEAQNCFVLLYPEGMVELNPSAGEVLQLCDGQNTVQTVIDLLDKKFDNPEGLAADVYEFLASADSNGWLNY